MRESSKNQHARQLKYADKSFIASYANQSFLNTIREMLSEISFSSVLDAGCGEGVSLAQAYSISPAARFAGFDLDKTRVAIGAQTVKTVRLFVANAHHIPFESATFDAVLCLETLEHVGEPSLAIAEIARVAKRYALFSVPNEPWWRLGNMARLKYLKNFGNTPGHINHWTVGELKKLIQSNFKILKTKQPFLWNFVLAEKTSPD